jgi:hypothetical protein
MSPHEAHGRSRTHCHSHGGALIEVRLGLPFSNEGACSSLRIETLAALVQEFALFFGKTPDEILDEMCTATCGSGARMSGTTATTMRRWMAPHGSKVGIQVGVSSAAVPVSRLPRLLRSAFRFGLAPVNRVYGFGCSQAGPR